MANISRSIKFLRVVVITTIILLFVSQVWLWFPPVTFDFLSVSHEILEEYGGVDALNTKQKILGFIITSIPIVTLLWALTLLLKLTEILAAGRWFDKLCEDYCTRVGRWLVIYVVLNVLHRTVLVTAVTMDNPPGDRHFSISFSTDDLMALVPAIFALIIGHMVRLAREKQDELNEII